MLFMVLLGVVLLLALLLRFNPKIDLVLSGNKKLVLLWYTQYDVYTDSFNRRYIELFRF